MKLYLSVLALAAVASVALAGDKEYMKLKKWAMMKAMEGCFGQETMRQFMVKIKSSAAKCMKIDAPELDLPMFKNPVRVVNALSHGAYDPQHQHPMGGAGHHHHAHSHGPASGGSNRGDWLEEVMKKVFFQKMMQKFLEDEFVSGDDDGDLDMLDSMGSMGGGRRAAMRFFKKGGSRYTRQSGDENDNRKQMFELGDRLNAKLQQAKAAMEAKIGNYTCMLRECGVVDASNNLADVGTLQAEMDKYPIADQWLKDRINEDVANCHAFAEAVPQQVLEDCVYGPQLAKVKIYKKCLKMHKMRTCMNFDVKQKLESNFNGSLEDLVETTQMDEDELLPLVMTLLEGPEVGM